MSDELKFDADQQIRPIHTEQSMSGFSYKRYDPRLRVPTLVRLLMRSHLVHSEKGAQITLLISCVVFSVVAIVLFIWGIKEPEIIRLQLTI